MAAKRNSTITRRLAARVFLVGLLLSALVIAALIPLHLAKAKEEAISEGYILAEGVSLLYQTLAGSSDFERAQRALLRVARVTHVAYVNVMDQQGEVLYSTDAGQVGKRYVVKYGVKDEGAYLEVTHVAARKTGPIGAVTIAIERKALFDEYYRFYLALALGFLVVVGFLTLLIGWMTEGIVGSRLAKLVTTMEDAEKGSFLVRAKIDMLDEVGAVGQAFNRMLAALTSMQVRDIEREIELKVAQEQLSIKAELERVLYELKQSNERLKRRVKAQELLMDAAHQLGGILNKELLVNRLVTLVRDKLGWPDFAIFLTHTKDGNENYLKLAIASGLPNIDIIKALTFSFGEGITGLVAESKTPALIKDLAREKRIKIRDYIETQDNVPEFLTKGSMLSVPMLYQGKAVGVMDFFHPELNAFDDDDAALSHALGALAAVALVNADLYEATLELATSDPLTGVLNRRAMERLLDAEVNRAERFSTPLALLMIDVDHFKNFNDRMGHVVGDLVLKEVAHRLKLSIRKVDAVARFGGEEFCVILPQTDARQALEVAHKLCIAIRAIEIRGSSKQPLGHFSISVGVAVFPTHVPKTLSRNPSVELIHAADEALYQAKREGRDRVVTYEAK